MKFSDQKLCIYTPNLKKKNVWIGWSSNKRRKFMTVFSSHFGLITQTFWGTYERSFDYSGLYELPHIFKWLYDAERLSRES